MRKELRQQITTQLQSDLTLGLIENHLPKKFGGNTPICTVEIAGWSPNYTKDETGTSEIMFIIGFWARRHEDAEEAHDFIDDLADDLVTFLRKNYNAWPTRPSTVDYDVIDDIQYQVEFHFVTIQWW